MTLLEVIVAFVVLGILATIMVTSFTGSTERATEEGAKIRLATTQVAARQVASGNQATYPLDAAAKIKPQGVTILGPTAASTKSSEVSLQRTDEYQLVLVSASGEKRCMVVLESLQGAARWGQDSSIAPGQCTAANAAAVAPSIVSKSSKNPTDVDFG